MDTVTLEREGEIAWLRMNRPEALNAFDQPMVDAMLARLADLAVDRTARAAILIGEGRSFSTGIDLKALGARALSVEWFRDWQRVIVALEQLEIPLVIGVRGNCLGGGLMMLLTGDYRIAGDDLRTGLSAVKYGIIPGSATYRLAAAIGTLNARRLCLFTEFVGAPEAFRLGLVDRVVPAAQVTEVARETAQRVTRFSRTALKETKRLLAQAASLDLAGFERAYLEAQQRCLDAGDVKPWNKLDHHKD